MTAANCKAPACSVHAIRADCRNVSGTSSLPNQTCAAAIRRPHEKRKVDRRKWSGSHAYLPSLPVLGGCVTIGTGMDGSPNWPRLKSWTPSQAFSSALIAAPGPGFGRHAGSSAWWSGPNLMRGSSSSESRPLHVSISVNKHCFALASMHYRKSRTMKGPKSQMKRCRPCRTSDSHTQHKPFPAFVVEQSVSNE